MAAYCILRAFSWQLRLSPFPLEHLAAALTAAHPTPLLDEVREQDPSPGELADLAKHARIRYEVLERREHLRKLCSASSHKAAGQGSPGMPGGDAASVLILQHGWERHH